MDPALVLGPAIGVLLLAGIGAVVTHDEPQPAVAFEAGTPSATIPLGENGPAAGIEGLIPATDGPTEQVEPGAPPATEAAVPEATAATAPPPAPPVSATAEAGSCFDGNVRSILDVLTTDCAGNHGNEIYVLLAAPGGPEADYPGESVLQERVAEVCRGQAFDDYVGISWAESRFFTAPIVPTAESWAAGDRSLACFVYDLSGSRIGSARGSME